MVATIFLGLGCLLPPILRGLLDTPEILATVIIWGEKSTEAGIRFQIIKAK